MDIVSTDIKKGQRLRSVAYPSYTLDHSIEFTKKIYDSFGQKVYTPTSAISDVLQMSGGSFVQNLSTCVQYGLLTLKKGEGYMPTSRFRKVILPLPEEDPIQSKIECLYEPELYKKIFDHFNNGGILPNEKGLINTLDRLFNVKGAGAEKAVKVFEKNLKTYSLIGDDRKLKNNAYISFVEVESEATNMLDLIKQDKENSNLLLPENPEIELPQKQNIQEDGMKNEYSEFSVLLNGDRSAKVVLPKNFTEADIARIVKVVSAYLP